MPPELEDLLARRVLILPVWGWLATGALLAWRRLNALPMPATPARPGSGPKPLEYAVRYRQRWKIAGSGAGVSRFLGELMGVTLEEVEALLLKYVLKAGALTQIATRGHSELQGLSEGDPHTQYALLAGRGASQKLIGGANVEGKLELQSTASASRGKVLVVDETEVTGPILFVGKAFGLRKTTAAIGVAGSQVLKKPAVATSLVELSATVAGVELEGWEFGISSGPVGMIAYLYLVKTSEPVKLLNESSSESSQFRLSTGATIELQPGHTIQLLKSTTGWVDLALR